MTFFALLVCDLVAGGAAAVAGRPVSVDAGNAAYCLEKAPFGFFGGTKTIRLRTVTYDRTAEEPRGLWLFVETGNRSYDVFAFVVNDEPGEYWLTNNGSIRWNGRTIDETGAFLGGIWTHQRVEASFRRSLAIRPVEIALARNAPKNVRCLYFADR